MKKERKSIISDFDFKVASESEDGGRGFSGYASVYEITDSYNDVMTRNCFADSLMKRDSYPLHYQHNSSEPTALIGHFKAMEHDHGLYIEAKLLKGDAVDNVYECIKNGSLRGLSIGAYIREDRYENDVRYITRAELTEVSVVSSPANPETWISIIRSADGLIDCKTWRMLERILRDVGLSQKDAKAQISSIKSMLRDAVEPRDEEAEKGDTKVQILKTVLEGLRNNVK